MNRCVNMNHPDFKALLNESGIDFLTLYADVSLWQDRNNTDVIPSLEQLVPNNEKVEYRFQAVDKILAKLPILNKWWKTLPKDTFWKKFKELGIPNEQVQLYQESTADTFEEVVVDTLAKYSFDVEIKTSVMKYASYVTDPEYDRQGNIINNGDPTQYYSNLTVPGGVAYKELEIKTPQITPSIKGHADFSTNQGIGWFRVDELETDKSVRRLLELQSDGFQKSRDGTLYSLLSNQTLHSEFGESENQFGLISEDILNPHEYDSEEEYDEDVRALEKEKREALKKDKFLQLLNKDGNWIKFFIQSIVQRTRKEVVYEKSLPDIEAKVLSLQKQGLLKIGCK